MCDSGSPGVHRGEPQAPGSTLLLLVAALAWRTRVLELYTEAIERGYQFYSYGDATLFLA